MLAHTFTLIFLQLAGLTNIARTNQLVRQAKEAYSSKQYAVAAKSYSEAINTYKLKNDAALVNMAHAYYNAGNRLEASKAYSTVATTLEDKSLRSIARNQLGVISERERNYSEAAVQLKQALREDPNNQIARINYERVLLRKEKIDPEQNKKKSEKEKQEEKKQQEQEEKQKQQAEQAKPQNQPNQQQQDGNKGGPKPTEENKGQKPGDKQEQGKDGSKPKPGGPDQGKKEGKKGMNGSPDSEKPGQDNKDGKCDDGKTPQEAEDGNAANSEQLKGLQIDPEKAKMILEAMRSNEVQYLQQRRFRREKKGRDKKDW